VSFFTPPAMLSMSQFQINPNLEFLLAIAYPIGTSFSIAYIGASWCNPSWGVCSHTVQQAPDLATVKAHFGDFYYWDNTNGVLWMRVVQRSETFGNCAQGGSCDVKNWTNIPQPDVIFTRNDIGIIEVSGDTYIQINASNPSGLTHWDNGVPAGIGCPTANPCPADSGWPSTTAGGSRLQPCPAGQYGSSLRTCTNQGVWNAPLTDNCYPGTGYCQADSGWDTTAKGTTLVQGCTCGMQGFQVRYCDVNATWGPIMNGCNCSNGGVSCINVPTPQPYVGASSHVVISWAVLFGLVALL